MLNKLSSDNCIKAAIGQWYRLRKCANRRRVNVRIESGNPFRNTVEAGNLEVREHGFHHYATASRIASDVQNRSCVVVKIPRELLVPLFCKIVFFAKFFSTINFNNLAKICHYLSSNPMPVEPVGVAERVTKSATMPDARLDLIRWAFFRPLSGRGSGISAFFNKGENVAVEIRHSV